MPAQTPGVAIAIAPGPRELAIASVAEESSRTAVATIEMLPLRKSGTERWERMSGSHYAAGSRSPLCVR